MAVLRAVSFNLWKNDGRFADRMRRILSGLVALNADIIALQECFFAPAADIDVASQIAHRCNLQLARAAQREKPRLHGTGLLDSRSDLALLTKEHHSVATCIALPEDPRDGERRLLIANLIWEGRPLRIGCTHFTHLADGQPLRRAQADAAVTALLSDPGCTTLFMGDLNGTAAAPELAGLFQHPRLHPECVAQAQTAASGGRVGGAIDHVLLFPALGECWRYDRQIMLPPDPEDLPGGPSDHPAILCNLERLS